MIIRMTNKLANKVKEDITNVSEESQNPFIDWCGNLFTVERTQYIIVTNTRSLLSIVFYGRGVTDENQFLKVCLMTLREFLEDLSCSRVYENSIAPYCGRITFSKPDNRSLLGSMNELVNCSKCILETHEISPYDLSFRINETPMGALKYQNPVEAFKSMTFLKMM